MNRRSRTIDVFQRLRAALRALWCAPALALLLGTLDARAASVPHIAPGGYYWYVPEHEGYNRTAFYAHASFNSGMVRITRTQRFRYGPGARGWVLLEFDVTGNVYIHQRVFRTLVYDPAASDPWYEFQRASIFPEEPQKIEARLKGLGNAPPQSAATDSSTPAGTNPKTPAWKRYKDSWGIKSGRPAPAGSEQGVTDSSPPRTVTTSPTTKPRSKYPLLTPLGSEQPQDAAPGEASGQDAEAPASR